MPIFTTLQKNNSACKRAFSLIEISIVIVIIAIFSVGVIGSKHLIKKSRISTAHSLSKNSPISSIKDNALWLESSLEDIAFIDNIDAYDGDNLSSWGDISYNQNKVLVRSVGNGPTYANTINYIQAVQFSGSLSDHLLIEDASFLNNSDYTIFILEKRESASDNNYFIGDVANVEDNETLLLGYVTDSLVVHSQGPSNQYNAGLESYASYSDKPRLFAFMSDSNKGKKIYINGVLAAQSSNIEQLSGIDTLPIGKGYNGEIGEIVIFTRALKKVEREEIENYLGTKWNSPINRDQVAGGSCLSGVITSSGCNQACVVSVNGSSDTILEEGESKRFSCDATGYKSGLTIEEYSCVGGVLDPMPAISQCIDDLGGCESGYFEFGGACSLGCDVSAIIGSDIDMVVQGSTSVVCNEDGYAGQYDFSTCSAGEVIPAGVCGCDIDNNYADSNADNICESPCVLSASDSALSEDVFIISGESSYDCADSGYYTGVINFDSCYDGATLLNISGSCEEDELPFISTWTTSVSNDEITLPLMSGGVYDFTINWGDASPVANVTSYNDVDATHTYSAPGSYVVTISGDINGWNFTYGQGSDASKITDISQWGSLRLGNLGTSANYGGYFRDAVNLDISASDVLDTSDVTSISSFFSGCSSLTSVPSLSSWDFSNVTSASAFCYMCSSFNQSFNMNLPLVTDMSLFLYGATSFNSDFVLDTPLAISFRSMLGNTGLNRNLTSSHFPNTSNVNNMDFFVSFSPSFNGQITFDTSNVTSFAYMFRDSSSYNQPIAFSTASATNLSNMLYNTSFDQDISQMDITNVTNMSNMLTNTPFSKTNYELLLNQNTGWPSQMGIQSGVQFNSDGAKYSDADAQAGRNILTSTHGWNITDGGFE